MARSFAHLATSIWSDRDFTGLSWAAQRVYLLLLSQPKVSLAGVLDYTPSRWAKLAGDTSTEDVERAVLELEAARFVVLDWEAEELLIRSFTRHDWHVIKRNRNLVKGLWRAWVTASSDMVRKVAVDNLPDDIWSFEGVDIPSAALQMCRSDRLELPVPTNSSDHGSNQQSEPPSSLIPHPVTTTSHSQVTPSGGTIRPAGWISDPVNEAAALMAANETERRLEQGDPIQNPAGYAKARAQALRTEHEPVWRQLIADDAEVTPAELVAFVDGKRPTPKPTGPVPPKVPLHEPDPIGEGVPMPDDVRAVLRKASA